MTITASLVWSLFAIVIWAALIPTFYRIADEVNGQANPSLSPNMVHFFSGMTAVLWPVVVLTAIVKGLIRTSRGGE